MVPPTGEPSSSTLESGAAEPPDSATLAPPRSKTAGNREEFEARKLAAEIAKLEAGILGAGGVVAAFTTLEQAEAHLQEADAAQLAEGRISFAIDPAIKQARYFEVHLTKQAFRSR